MPDLQTSLENLNSRYTEITDLIENIYEFIDYGDGEINYIDDGGADAFDGGNYITTSIISDIAVQNGQEGLPSLNYTHTQSDNGSPPYDDPPMDGAVVESTESESSDSYFTNMYPGLFVFGASNPEAITVHGNFGSDSNSTAFSSDENQNTEDILLSGSGFPIQIDSETFTVYTRYNIDSSSGDPTIHHLIIAPGNDGNWIHQTTINEQDYIDQVEFGASRPETAFYFMFMSHTDTGGEGGGGGLPQASNIVAIATKMIEIAFGATEQVVIRTTHPVYTFEVVAYNLVELFGSCLPENYNQMLEIYNGRTVHIHTLTHKMKHGDRFTVEGHQARYLKKMYVDVPANSPMRLLKIVE